MSNDEHPGKSGMYASTQQRLDNLQIQQVACIWAELTGFYTFNRPHMLEGHPSCSFNCMGGAANSKGSWPKWPAACRGCYGLESLALDVSRRTFLATTELDMILS